MNRKRILLICLGILFLGAAITFLIFSTEPTAQSEAATKRTAMLVDVIRVEKGNYHPVLVTTGRVHPVEDVMLSPLVDGQVIRRTSSFVPGGFVREGELLLQIDPSDYRNIVQLRKSELQEAQTELALEMGRQGVAEQDLQLAAVDSLSLQERSLVLRQPQLEAVKARIEGSRAAVAQAELDLARTSIRAPFDAHILQQNVTVGAQVSPGDDLGRLVGREFYWVTINLPLSQLRWLKLPEKEGEAGSLVKIRNTSAWPEGTYRKGQLYRQIGALDDETRLARVLVRIPDPLAYLPESKDLPPLMIGEFVEAQVLGVEVQDVIRLHRDFLRRNNTVWVMQDNKLSLRKVEVLLTDSQFAYIRKGLKSGDQVVTTNLSTVVEGTPLRTEVTE